MFTNFEIYLLCLWAASYVLDDAIRTSQELMSDPSPYPYDNVTYVNTNLYSQYM